MAIKQLMADTAQLVDFFNTLTDVDIEMITFDHTGYHEVGSIEKDLH